MNEKVLTRDRRRDYRYKIHAQDYFVIKHLSRFIHSKIAQYVTPGKRVGDIGCGEQPFRREIEHAGGMYAGIDLTQNSQNTVDVLATITNIPLPDNSFDIILCTEVLEHVPDTYLAFKELARLTKPSGKIILTVPFAYPLHEEPYDFLRLTRYQIHECAEKSGLRIIELTTSGNELEVIATVWCNMWNRLGQSPQTVLQKYWNKLMRIPVNLVALAGTALIGKVLPKKYYLNLLVVLTK